MKVIVEADGGSRGNPGPAGYGAVVWTADRETVLAESKQAIGIATNNVAEYRGLIAGLEEAAKVGATDVGVRMDSKLVVEQMSGRWKVKHPDLRVLIEQATAVAKRFDSIDYAWIPRAENSHADRLANEAMDAAAELAKPASGEAEKAATSSPGWTGARGEPTRFLLLRHGQTRIVHAAAVFRPRQPGADRSRSAAGGSRCAVPGEAGRRQCGHRLTAAARVRHGGEGGQGAGARRHRRRRPDRDGLRRVGRSHLLRGRRKGSGATPEMVARHQRNAARRRELRQCRRPGAAGPRPDHLRARG